MAGDLKLRNNSEKISTTEDFPLKLINLGLENQ